MARLTAFDLVDQISQLDPTLVYEYVSGKSRLRIVDIQKPEGPIYFSNLKPDGSLIREGTVSKGQLARMALVCSSKPNYPLHIDRVFSAGGNSRSALETLLAYTPHFFMCNPQRIDSYTGEILTNLKHIMWCPDEFHPIGEIVYKEYNEVITEVELEVSFGQVTITQEDLEGKFDSIAAKTIHTQMQIALIEIGNALDFRTWIAKNDRSIPVGNTTLGHLPGVLQSLNEVPILYTAKIKDAASLIDCIWFTKDGDRIPAIIEIEHTTGVTSGLTRMQKLHEVSPSITKNFTIVAPDNLRNKVVTEANQKIYRELKAKYMPYSTIRELYGLIQRYSLKGVAEHTFIYPFMEQIVAE